MRSWKFGLKPIAVAAVALSTSALALAQSLPASSAEGAQLWFVELAGRPVADGATVETVQAEQAAFRAAALLAGVNLKERRSFNTLFNGISLAATSAERDKLMRVTGVKAMYPVDIVSAPTPEEAAGSALDLANALALTRVNIAQNSLGLTGAGVKVGVIDSGIDIDHPAFGGTGAPGTTPFPSARIVAGWDFVGDGFNSQGTGAALIPVPDPNPDDCGGHGTHVAGIIGANGGGLMGVAPGVTFGAYRVFGCNGSTTADIILAALERALADGMQVINQSLGAARQWPQYPTAQASGRLARKGVVMVASIGNNGPGGSSPDALWAAGAPGVGDGVIGVASFDNTRSTQLAFRSFPGGELIPYNRVTGSPPSAISGVFSLARTGTTTTVNDACTALTAGSLTGQVALVRRGTCGFNVKAINAQAAGAVAVILYNNSPVDISPTVAGPPAPTVPVVWLTAANGAVLDAKIAAGGATMEWTSQVVTTPVASAGLISGFSSFGMAADLTMKPDLGAPGGSIYSSYPLELGSYASLSGTSMSSPHVAGAAALILQALPNAALGRDSAVVGRNAPPMINMATRLMNTSQPKNWSGNPTLGLLDYSFRQGAGMIDVVAAVQSQQFVVPGKFSTGESAAGAAVQRLTIRNDALVPVTYTMGHTPGLAAGPNTQTGASYALTGTFNAPATVTFSATSVVVPARSSASVMVTVEANPLLADRGLYGGYITLTPQSGGTALSVPYAGFKGDYQTTQVLTPTVNNFPWLAKLASGTFSRQVTGASYTMVGDDTPWVLIHFDHHARTVKLEAIDSTGTSKGTISEDQYVGRNSTPAGFFQFSWNGVTSQGVQPNGTYTIRVSALKALGNPANPADWEVWNSPTATLARP